MKLIATEDMPAGTTVSILAGSYCVRVKCWRNAPADLYLTQHEVKKGKKVELEEL